MPPGETGCAMPVRFESRFIRCDDPRFTSCHASTVVEALDGDLIAAWHAGSPEKAKDTAILYSRLRRGGRHWSTPTVLVDTPDRAEGNPVLFLDNYGTLWLFWVTMLGDDWDSCIVRARTSSENGHSWDPPITLQESPGWMTRHKPVRLRSGDVSLPLYDERDLHSFLLLTSDCAHWEARGEIRSEFGVTEPSLAVLGDGSLLTFLRPGERDPQRRLWSSVSQDAGRTWSRPVRTSLPNSISGADVVRLDNGHLVLAFNNSTTERTPLCLAVSLDEGRTWRYVRELEIGPGEFSYPAVIGTTDGDIQVTYTWKRDQIKHVSLNEEWIREEGVPFPG
jgi:predicted neuraminidase